MEDPAGKLQGTVKDHDSVATYGIKALPRTTGRWKEHIRKRIYNWELWKIAT